MSNQPPADVITYNDVRMSCPQCGRFIKPDQVREEDYRDHTAYYGVSTRTWVDCKRCGTLERDPLIVITGELTMAVRPGPVGPEEPQR